MVLRNPVLVVRCAVFAALLVLLTGALLLWRLGLASERIAYWVVIVLGVPATVIGYTIGFRDGFSRATHTLPILVLPFAAASLSMVARAAIAQGATGALAVPLRLLSNGFLTISVTAAVFVIVVLVRFGWPGIRFRNRA